MVAMIGGILLGPVIGGLLNEINHTLPFVVPAAVGIVLLFLLPRVKPAEYKWTPARLNRRHLAAIPGLASGLLLAASTGGGCTSVGMWGCGGGLEGVDLLVGGRRRCNLGPLHDRPGGSHGGHRWHSDFWRSPFRPS